MGSQVGAATKGPDRLSAPAGAPFAIGKDVAIGSPWPSGKTANRRQ